MQQYRQPTGSKDTYGAHHLTSVEYPFFSSCHRTYTNVDQIQSHKTNTSSFKII